MNKRNDNLQNLRLPMLDVVRIFAAVSVFFYHAYWNMRVDFGAANGFVSQANICMTLFFLLSGFLFSYTGRNRRFESSDEISVFLKKRLITLLPLYYLVSLFRIAFFGHYSAQQLATALPYDIIPTFPLINFYNFGRHSAFWFVADILMAYALFPYLIKSIRRLRRGDAVYAFLALYLMRCTMENIPTLFESGGMNLYNNPLCRVMEFYMGAVLFQFFRSFHEQNCLSGRIEFPPVVFHLAVIALLALLVILTDRWTDFLGKTDRPMNGNFPVATIPFFTAILLVSALAGDMPKIMRPLSFLSKLAYPFWLATDFTSLVMSRKASGVMSQILFLLVINFVIALVLYGVQLAVERILRALGERKPQYRGKLLRGLLIIVFAAYWVMNVDFFLKPAVERLPLAAYDFEHTDVPTSGSFRGIFNDEGEFAWASGEAFVRLKLADHVRVKVRTSSINMKLAGETPTIELLIEGEQIGNIPLSMDINEASFAVPQNMQGKTAELKLICKATFVPERDIAGSQDDRELSFQIFYIGE